MSSNNTPYSKVNDSDKQRPSDGKILPGEIGHTNSGEDGGCGEKVKQNKWKIVGVLVVLIVAVILAVTLSGSGDKPTPPGPAPGPTPPGPTPPEPINTGYNPYYLDENSTISV